MLLSMGGSTRRDLRVTGSYTEAIAWYSVYGSPGSFTAWSVHIKTLPVSISTMCTATTAPAGVNGAAHFPTTAGAVDVTGNDIAGTAARNDSAATSLCSEACSPPSSAPS